MFLEIIYNNLINNPSDFKGLLAGEKLKNVGGLLCDLYFRPYIGFLSTVTLELITPKEIEISKRKEYPLY